MRRGVNLHSLGMYWTRTAARRRFLALFAPEIPNPFGRTTNIMICT
jgi:hypothetical protein